MVAPLADPAPMHEAVLAWYDRSARDLPWRVPGVEPWAVLVSEVMLQQTPVARVRPIWDLWMRRWPTPSALAQESPAEVIRAWDRLGYPRRALRLQEAAAAIRDRHHDRVPRTSQELLALPGVGPYTAAAIRAFAFGERDVVLDTNVRRVLTRVLDGAALPRPHLGAGEWARAESVLPSDPATSARWNVAVMELGALVCTASAPACGRCPVRSSCLWQRLGAPPDAHAARRRRQPWAGTDRQARGRLMAAFRAATQPLSISELPTWGDDEQRDRALASLVSDRLVSAQGSPARYRLP